MHILLMVTVPVPIHSLCVPAKLVQNPWFQELPMYLGDGILVKCAGMCMTRVRDLIFVPPRQLFES